MTGSRHARIGAAIHHELTGILQGGMNDPRVGFVTVTGVEMSGDLRRARVFLSILGDDAARQDSLAAIEHARGWLRRELAHRLNMRRTPELEFRLDTSVDRGERIERLLREEGVAGAGSPEPDDGEGGR
jgi:ribosome-binding factor A